MVPGHGSKDHRGTGAPIWLIEIFERLLAANGGELGGFFDVFAWRQPGEIRFDEVKVRPNRIGLSQRKFLKTVLRFYPSGNSLLSRSKDYRLSPASNGMTATTRQHRRPVRGT